MDPTGIVGWLLHSPEPLIWSRLSATVARADEHITFEQRPGVAKLTEAQLTDNSVEAESVTLLLRETMDLTDYHLQYRFLGKNAPNAPEDDFAPIQLNGFERTNVYFNETFRRPLVLRRWQFHTDSAAFGQAPRWRVRGGKLRQVQQSFPLDPLEQKGHYLVRGSQKWQDYRCRATVSGRGRAPMGIMCRFQNPENYYLFVLEPGENTQRLIKCIEGQNIALWEGSFQRAAQHLISISCLANTLTGTLDGEEVFRIEDTDLTAGKTGLYAPEDGRITFEDVRVVGPYWEWHTYYTFDEEPPLPAGTRVRVHGQPAEDVPAPDEEVGLVHLFARSSQNRLPAAGVDLRLLDPDRVVLHRRRFLPEGDYRRIDGSQLVRKADGTGLFLILPDAEANEQLRLNLEYRRDNRSVDPNSDIQSQAGSRDVEVVTIEIPSQATNQG
jgi:hypothetical protein